MLTAMGASWSREAEKIIGGLAVALLMTACGDSHSEEERGAYEDGYYFWADALETSVADEFTFGPGSVLSSGVGFCEEYASYFTTGSIPYPYPDETIALWVRGCKDAFEKNADPEVPDPEKMAVK